MRRLRILRSMHQHRGTRGGEASVFCHTTGAARCAPCLITGAGAIVEVEVDSSPGRSGTPCNSREVRLRQATSPALEPARASIGVLSRHHQGAGNSSSLPFLAFAQQIHCDLFLVSGRQSVHACPEKSAGNGSRSPQGDPQARLD